METSFYSDTLFWTGIFRVQANAFETVNTDEIATWTSEVIDITSYSNVDITINLSETGNLDNDDFIRVYYRLNGGALTFFPNNGNLINDFTSAISSVTALNGTSLQIVIEAQTTATNEFIQFDDISVTGFPDTPPLAFDIFNNQPADKVYGQPNFTSNAPGNTATLARDAYHTAVDRNTGKVFISEVGNHRILRYANIDALTNGEAAEAVLGQTNLTNNGAATAQNRFNQPCGIFVDNAGRLWVAEFGNSRVLRFDNASSLPNGANANGVLGQANYVAGAVNRGGTLTVNTMNTPVAVFVENNGTLWVADMNNNRILRFNNAAAKANGANADGVLGKANFTTGNNGSTQSDIGWPTGVTLDNSGRLYTSDAFNNRVLWWDNAGARPNGTNADGLLGQPNYTSGGAGLSQSTFNNPRMITVTPDGQFLAVSDASNNRIMIYINPGAVTGLVNANFEFGQPNFTSNIANNGGLSARSINNPRGIYFYQTQNFENYLFVSDRGNHRTKLYLLFDLFYTTDVLTPITDTFKSTELDGDKLTFRILDSTNKGSITLDNDSVGIFTYIPIISAIDYSDSVIYEVCDKDGCDTSIVIFNVLSAIKIWVRADTGVVGSPITSWKNIAVKDDSIYTSGANAPSFVDNQINFNPVLRFDGTNDQFTDQGIINAVSNVHTSTFIVAKPRIQKNQYLLKEALPTGGSYANRDLWGDGRAYYDAGTVNELSAPWGGTLNTPYIWSFVQKPTSERIFRNGLQIATKAGGNILGNRSTLYIGSDGTNYYDGDIAEVMLYQHIIGDAFDLGQEENIETYLAIKYGITLSQTPARDYLYADADTLSPGVIIYHAETTHDLYDHDIAGIGFDSTFYYLNQPKSMSINPDASVIMERQSNWKNLSFIVWGNNDSAYAVKNFEQPGGIAERLKREWQVDTTGRNGTVKISFYIAPFKTIFSNQDFILLRDIDGDFTNATKYTTGMTVSTNGDTVSFSGIQFRDGEYFTLATGTGVVPIATAPHCGLINISDTIETVTLRSDASLWLRADKTNKIYQCPSQLQQQNAPSGTYWFDPDGDGLNPFLGYYDASEGGGWLMVLNYLHLGGTNPALNYRNNSLPLLGSSTLGVDEQGTQFWGHAIPSLLNQFNITEVRFFGRTSNHARTMHFRTSNANTINYIRSGTGSMTGINAGFTALTGHNAFLPNSTANYFTNQGDDALTNFPFWLNGTYHWGIRGNGSRWEVDDYPNNSSRNTLHRVFIRVNPASCNYTYDLNPIDGASVSQWSDQTNNLNQLSQNTIGNQPTYKNNTTDNINFNPTIDFDGNDGLSTPSVIGTANSELTVFLVAEEDVRTINTIFGFVYPTNGANRLQSHFPWAGDNNIYWDCGTAVAPQRINAVSPQVVGTPSIGVFTNSLSTNSQRVYLNGSLLVSDASGHNVTGLNNTVLGILYNGRIAEFIVDSSLFSINEIQKIETYLAIKYGITLGHNYLSYKNGAVIYDMSNGYANGVFGIGRNSSLEFYQPRSKSETAYSGITLQTTIDIGDENYLLTGHNGGALTRGTLAGQTNVLARRWFAKMTGGVGTVDLELDLATIAANTGASPSNVRILIANNPAFTNAYVIPATSVVGGIAYFKGLPLYDKYYTFSAAP